MSYKPPFTVSAEAISMIASISSLMERYAIQMEQADAPRLRRATQIESIHSSLAIEGNTLTESQVADVIDGKSVIAPLRELQEVKNAIAAYDLSKKLNPFSQKDLLKAHGTMMFLLTDRPGQYRTGGVGVFSSTRIVHMAPPASRVGLLMNDLFSWLKKSKDHLLLRSCAFHYEFEFIHPFEDGNGRMGRLWQSLILGALHPVFFHLPVESMVCDSKKDYYRAIGESSTVGDSGAFIDFMLGMILRALEVRQAERGAIGGASGGASGGANDGPTAVLDHLKSVPGCRANILAGALNMPLRTVQRYLGRLTKEGKIEYLGASKNGGYYIRDAYKEEE
jgi:Fic family protein